METASTFNTKNHQIERAGSDLVLSPEIKSLIEDSQSIYTASLAACFDEDLENFDRVILEIKNTDKEIYEKQKEFLLGEREKIIRLNEIVNKRIEAVKEEQKEQRRSSLQIKRSFYESQLIYLASLLKNPTASSIQKISNRLNYDYYSTKLSQLMQEIQAI